MFLVKHVVVYCLYAILTTSTETRFHILCLCLMVTQVNTHIQMHRLRV